MAIRSEEILDPSWGLNPRCLRFPDAEDRILVIDDGKCCELMTEILDRAGYSVEWTTDARFALERLTRRRYALVVSDIRMPGPLGADLVAKIREGRPRLRVLLVSAQVDEGTRDSVRALGAGLLAKPFPPGALLGAVRELLGPSAAPTGP
jgi:DNA-binding response OmpR family regulator